jgi:hypothetical protein
LVPENVFAMTAKPKNLPLVNQWNKVLLRMARAYRIGEGRT